MGGGPDVITNTPGPFNIPPELKPLIESSVQQAIGLQGQLPLSQFIGPNPQGIPGLTPEQRWLLDQYVGFAGQSDVFGRLPATGPETSSLNIMNQLSQSLMPSATGQGPLLNPVEQFGAGLTVGGTGLSPSEQQGLGLAGQSALLTPGELQAMSMAGQTSGQNQAENLAMNVGQQLSSGGPNSYQQLADQYVRLGVPLHSAEQAAYQQLHGGYTGGQMSQAEQQALNQLGFFTSGPFGQAPATLAAQQAFRRFQEPEIMQQLALAGLGRSGAVGTSLAEGEARALVPFLTQEMANRLQATGMGANIGQTAMARGLQATGMEAALGGAAQNRALQGAQTMAGIGGDVGRLGLGAGTLLAQLGQGQGARGLQAASLIGGLGENAATRGLTAAQLMSGVGQSEQARALQAGQQIAALGGQAGARPFQAAQALTGLAGMQANLGTTLAERARADTMNALQAAGVPREIAAQQAQATYNEFLRQQALSEGVSLGPLGQMLPSALARGQITNQSGGGIFGS